MKLVLPSSEHGVQLSNREYHYIVFSEILNSEEPDTPNALNPSLNTLLMQ